MPTVRRYTRQVDLNPLPGVRARAAETPDSLGAGAALAEGQVGAAIGEGAARLGGQVATIAGRIADEAKQEADRTAVLRASNLLADWQTKTLYDPQSGAFAQHGADALPLPEAVLDGFDQAAADIGSALTTPEQRDAFGHLRAQRRSALFADVQHHVFNEIDALHANEATSAVGNAVQDAIRHTLEPQRFQASLDEATHTLAASARPLGFGPERLKAETLSVTTAAHRGAIAQLEAAGYIEAAQVWFEQAKDEIDPTLWKGISDELAHQGVLQQAQQIADAVRAGGGRPSSAARRSGIGPRATCERPPCVSSTRTPRSRTPAAATPSDRDATGLRPPRRRPGDRGGDAPARVVDVQRRDPGGPPELRRGEGTAGTIPDDLNALQLLLVLKSTDPQAFAKTDLVQDFAGRFSPGTMKQLLRSRPRCARTSRTSGCSRPRPTRSDHRPDARRGRDCRQVARPEEHGGRAHASTSTPCGGRRARRSIGRRGPAATSSPAATASIVDTFVRRASP